MPEQQSNIKRRIPKTLNLALHAATPDNEALNALRSAQQQCQAINLDFVNVIKTSMVMLSSPEASLAEQLDEAETENGRLEEEIADHIDHIKSLEATIASLEGRLSNSGSSAQDRTYAMREDGRYSIDVLERMFYDRVGCIHRWQTVFYTVMGLDKSRFESYKQKGFPAELFERAKSILNERHASDPVQKKSWSDDEVAFFIELDGKINDNGKRISEKQMAEAMTKQFKRSFTPNMITGQRDRFISAGKLQPRKARSEKVAA